MWQHEVLSVAIFPDYLQVPFTLLIRLEDFEEH